MLFSDKNSNIFRIEYTFRGRRPARLIHFAIKRRPGIPVRQDIYDFADICLSESAIFFPSNISSLIKSDMIHSRLPLICESSIDKIDKSQKKFVDFFAARDGNRTRGNQLGKLAPYH